jgi:hypothetical protein
VSSSQVDTIWSYRDQDAWIPCGNPPLLRDLFAQVPPTPASPRPARPRCARARGRAGARANGRLLAQDDGFDLYIDCARYLPDNVSLSAVQCFLTAKDLRPFGNTFKEIDLRSPSVMSPVRPVPQQAPPSRD